MEILVVLVILIIISAFLFAFYNYLLTNYISIHEEGKLEQSAVNALGQMSLELKVAPASSIGTRWPDSGTGKAGALVFQADLNNDGQDEDYIYYLYHPDDSRVDDGNYLAGPPASNRFYRLYKFTGGETLLKAQYSNHPGELLAEDVVPPSGYESSDGSYFSYDGVHHTITIHLRLQRIKLETVKEKVVYETLIFARN